LPQPRQPTTIGLASVASPLLQRSIIRQYPPGKRAHKDAKGAKHAKAGGREGSKTAQVVALLERKGGATLAEIMKATGWQAHSVRGFISGTLGKKMGRTVDSTKRGDGERLYQLKG
jgi:hypothetical protein